MTLAPLWRNRDYLLIVAAGMVSSVGTKVSQLALPLLVLGLTQSPVWAGLLGAAQQLPYLLFSLPAGVWVDRVPRRRLLVGCDLARGLLLGSLPLAQVAGVLGLPQLALVVFLAGTCTVLFEVADLAALPQVVAAAQLAQARATSEGVEATATVIGPSLGGLLIGLGRTTVSGAGLAFLADSMSYLLSAGALLAVRRPLEPPPQPAERERLGVAIGAGLRFLWRHPALRSLLLLTTAVNFLQGPLTLCALVVAQQRLGLAPAQIGLLFGLAGGAALLGAALAARIYRPARLRLIVVGSLLLWALAALAVALAGSVALLALGLALTQLVWPVYAVAVVAYRLAATPDALQGRVISAFRTLSYGAEPLGLALGGLGLGLAGPQPMVGAIAGGLLLCAAVAGRVTFAVR